MNSQNSSTKAINLLTICRRAGKVIMGFDSVKDSITGGKAFCVCIANDISPKTLKETNYICDRDDIPVLKLDVAMDDLWGALGKRVGILSICDKGFAKRFSEILTEDKEVPIE